MDSDSSESNFNLPLINLRDSSLKSDKQAWIEARKFVKLAFEEYGCFLAVHDKFSSEHSDSIFMELQDLFNLRVEVKMLNTCETPRFGYLGPNALMPLYESMSFKDSTNHEAVRSFANQIICPSKNNHFCEMLNSYAKKVAELDQMVSKMIFESYGVEKYHDSHLGSVTYFLRFTKYRVPQDNETNLGTRSHTDKNYITILHQNQANGLEVQLKNGNWIMVDFPPSSVVIMAGDALSAWSNGRIQSPWHRVSMKGKETRYSVANFSYCNNMIQTPEELVDDEHPLLYKPFDNFGLLRFITTNEGQKAENQLKAYCGF